LEIEMKPGEFYTRVKVAGLIKQAGTLDDISDALRSVFQTGSALQPATRPPGPEKEVPPWEQTGGALSNIAENLWPLLLGGGTLGGAGYGAAKGIMARAALPSTNPYVRMMEAGSKLLTSIPRKLLEAFPGNMRGAPSSFFSPSGLLPGSGGSILPQLGKTIAGKALRLIPNLEVLRQAALAPMRVNELGVELGRIGTMQDRLTAQPGWRLQDDPDNAPPPGRTAKDYYTWKDILPDSYDPKGLWDWTMGNRT
jgi:hypothetical protein